ncbi:hypothetical protein MMPV_002916 [Pyropia vietnamensis]
MSFPSPPPPVAPPDPPEDLPTTQLSRRGTNASGSSSGSSASLNTSSTSSTSSDSLAPEDKDGAKKFRRVDSDDDIVVDDRRRRSTTASAGRFGGGGGGGGGGDHRVSMTGGWWRRTSVTSDGGRRESIGRGSGGARSRREVRALAASRGRVRAALLARDPGGYKRALAEKHDLEALFTGLAKLGDAVTAAKARGLTDLSRMLDDERAGVRQALDSALSEADEDAALAGLAAAGRKMEEALAMWSASAEEAAAEAAAAHAALPWYSRWADRDKDGVVSYREKRLWVTLGLLFLTTATCIVLVGLLVRDFVNDLKNPITHARFEDVEELPVPRLSFCIEGPAFSEELRGDRNFSGPSLFRITYMRLPPGIDATKQGRIEERPIEAGLLRELPFGPVNCSDRTGVLSTQHRGVTGIDCVYCYEKVADKLILHRGETAEENKLHNVELHFESYAPFSECMVSPITASNETVSTLRGLLTSGTALSELESKGALVVAPGVTGGITNEAVNAMTSKQLCNTAFFSGHFYPTPPGEETPRYNWTGTNWVAVNPEVEFSAPLVNYDQGVDVHVLDRLATANNTDAHDHESISGVPLGRVAANSLTQLFLSKRTLEHNIRKGAERIRFNEEQYVAKADVYPRLQQRKPGTNFFHVSIAYFSFTVEHYNTRSTYTVPMFLEQVIGYGGNFLGLSVFTFVVAPLLFMLGRQDASRATAAAKRAEALMEEGSGGGRSGGGIGGYAKDGGGGGGGGNDSDVEGAADGGSATGTGRPSTSSTLEMLGRVSPRTSAFGVLSRERIARQTDQRAGDGAGRIRSREISSWSMPTFLRRGDTDATNGLQAGIGGGGGAGSGAAGAAEAGGWASPTANRPGGEGV